MPKIQVALRVRPLSAREVDGKFPVVIAVENNFAFITDIRVPEQSKADSRYRYRQFQFDHGFGLNSSASLGASQTEIYNTIGPPLEKSAMEGYNACLLAYGQSGTGKTHTMLGSRENPGIIPRLCNSVWKQLQRRSPPPPQSPLKSLLRMEVSFMEIYREKVRDLLNPSEGHLKLREHPQKGIIVQNLRRVDVTEENSLLNLLWEGEKYRAIGTTGSNRRSSRSHAIWTIYLTRQSPNTQSLITNQIHLVDLAGSEKAGFATAKNLLAEGADINRSLVALGNVISCLAERASYIPFRDSTLTWLLKDCIGGNATTSIIITASPASCCHTQTLNSFRFASRARLVENKPKINVYSTIDPRVKSSPSTLYNIMSAIEIKKDISKLTKIIKSCQENGGILRGMTPRASWSRLVNALEDWSQIESEHLKLQKEAIQQNQHQQEHEVCDKESSDKSDAGIQANLPESPKAQNKMIGTEVFIPYSDSFKCLTWQQEKVQSAPNTSTPSYSQVTKTSSKSKPHSSYTMIQSKYLLPVKYPVSHHLNHESRITERIHGSFSSNLPAPQFIEYRDVLESLNDYVGEHSPVKRNRVVTFVQPKEINFESALFTSSLHKSPVPVVGQSQTSPESSSSSFDIENENMSTLVKAHDSKARIVDIYNKMDDDEILDSELEGMSHNDDGHKKCHLVLNKSSASKIQMLPNDHETFSFALHQVLKPNPFEDLNFNEISSIELNLQELRHNSIYRTAVGLELEEEPNFLPMLQMEDDSFWEDESPSAMLKLVPEESEYSFVDESITEWVQALPDNKVQIQMIESDNQLLVVSDDDESLADDDDEDVESYIPTPIPAAPLNEAGSPPSSKFRVHFSREIKEMEKIGQELKQLKKLSEQCQRYNIVGSFLQEIDELNKMDHFTPDENIDSHIEDCSGWNVDVEYAKVRSEIESLDKLLRRGSATSTTSTALSRTITPQKSYYDIPTRRALSSQSTVHPTSSTSSPSPDTQFVPPGKHGLMYQKYHQNQKAFNDHHQNQLQNSSSEPTFYASSFPVSGDCSQNFRSQPSYPGYFDAYQYQHQHPHSSMYARAHPQSHSHTSQYGEKAPVLVGSHLPYHVQDPSRFYQSSTSTSDSNSNLMLPSHSRPPCTIDNGHAYNRQYPYGTQGTMRPLTMTPTSCKGNGHPVYGENVLGRRGGGDREHVEYHQLGHPYAVYPYLGFEIPPPTPKIHEGYYKSQGRSHFVPGVEHAGSRIFYSSTSSTTSSTSSTFSSN